MALLLLRTFLIYFLIIVAMRLMGKKQLGELQPSELVSTILISNLASISIESPELPLLSSIVPVFVIVSLEILLSALCMASRRAEKLLSGSPRVVIQHGRLDQAQLADLRFTGGRSAGRLCAAKMCLSCPTWSLPSWRPTAASA